MPTYRVDRPGQKPRIIDAPNPAAARQHVSRSELVVTMITASQAFALAHEGATLELAGETANPGAGAQGEPVELGAAAGQVGVEVEDD